MQISFVLAKFLILAFIVVFSSIKLAKNASNMEESSKMSAAFLGVMLALATSMPEFVTGVTSTILGHPEMAVSNVLGSNFFNTTIIAIANIVYIKQMVYYHVNKKTNIINYVSLLMYAVVLIAFLLKGITYEIFWVLNISSIAILALYIISLKVSKNEEEDNVHYNHHDEKIFKKSFILFIIYGVVILFSSMLLSITAEELQKISGMQSTFIGAIFIGVTTSLPEFSSLITLVRIKQYDLGVSSVLGSNTFNFIILIVCDLFTTTDIYEPQSGLIILSVLGILILIITTLLIKFKTKNKFISIIFSLVIIGCYLYYMIAGA